MLITDLAYIDSTGYHYSDYPAFLAWLKDKYRGVYGADVYLESDSQDGQWLAIFAQALYDTAALGASTYNSFSPATAQGLGLARNVKINGIRKRSATFSTADVTLGGTTGTVIGAVGALGVVIDTLNQKWNIPITTIPDAGTITVTATAQLAGAVAALPHTINRIFTPTQGWQTVDNVAAASAGVAVESDAGLRSRQAISTANPSLTVFDGMKGAVANVAGVTASKGYENDTGSVDSNGIPAHKISMVVAGGDATVIAQTIALHKTPGAGTYGTTVVNVSDSHGMPLAIAFFRPTQVTINVEITLDVHTGYVSAYDVLIQNAVASAIVNALPNAIGAPIIITKLLVPANLPGTPAAETFDIVSLEISKNAAPVAGSNLVLAFNEIPICNPLVNVVIIR